MLSKAKISKIAILSAFTMLAFVAGVYHSAIGRSLGSYSQGLNMQQMMQHDAMEAQHQMVTVSLNQGETGLLPCCQSQQQLPSVTISSTNSGLQKGVAITLQSNDIQYISDLVPLENNKNLAKAPPGDADASLSSVIKIE